MNHLEMTANHPVSGGRGGAGIVVGLLGPTAVGKTAVAVELACRVGTRVISCDSMQVYRGFPVLTNQPTVDVNKGVVHEMVGIVDPGETFSAGQYAARVRPLIEEDLAEHGWALVVGGTGLYMRAALAPLDAAPAVHEETRQRLEARAAVEGPAALHAELARLDPVAAAAIDPRNTRRVMRALGVIVSVGRPWSGRADLWDPHYYHPTLVVGLTLDREELYRRIDLRTYRMVQDGAVEEVERLRGQGVRGEESHEGPFTGSCEGSHTGVRSAIGYQELCRFLDGAQTLEETVSQIAAATRRYARRQLTWLRKLNDAVIIDVRNGTPEEIAEHILALALSRDHPKGV